jgi:hypothetical protein
MGLRSSWRGERITARVRATFTRLACRIVAEAFTPSRG